MTQLLAFATLHDFFQGILTSAIKESGVQSSFEAEQYLVDLLCEYSNQSTLDALNQALGLAYAQAQHAALPKRMNQLKKVGDHSLYLTGFFRENLERNRIDVKYYEALGKKAYFGLSKIVNSHGEAPRLADVYGELSDAFDRFVDVLLEVRFRSDPSQERNPDLASLYQTWKTSPSPALERRLKAAGFQLVKGDDLN